MRGTCNCNANNPEQILDKIADRDGWSGEDLAQLSKMSADDFVAIFKSRDGYELKRALQGALKF